MTLAADAGSTAKARRWLWRNKPRAELRLSNAGGTSPARIGLRCASLLGFALFASAPAVAGEFAYGGGYMITRESNPTRVAGSTTQDTNHALFAGVAYQEQTDDLNANFLAQVEKRAYQVNDQLNDTNYFFNGTGVWTVIPQVLHWTFEDSLRDARLDITRPDSPTNRTQVNSLSTGPDLTLRFGATDSSVIGARYGRFDNNSTGNTTSFLFGYARYLHRTSERTTVSLNYEGLHAEFEGTGAIFPSTDRQDIFVHFETRPLPNTYTLDIGTSTLSRPGAETLDGPFFQVTAARQLTSETSVRALLLSNYSDTYTDMIRSLGTPLAPGDAIRPPSVDVLTPDVYYNERAELRYSSDNGRVGYDLRGHARRVDYQTLSLDFAELGGRLDWVWRASNFTHFYATGRYLEREFKQITQTDVEWEAILGLRFNLNQNFSLYLEGGRSAYETTAARGNIENTRVMALIGYSSGRLYTARSRR